MSEAHGASGSPLADMVAQQEHARRSGFFGKYRGKVIAVGANQAGKDNRVGQVQAQVPDVYGMAQNVPWANPAVPFAGNGYGFLMAPKVGDGVWIEFEAGNKDLPIWTGAWWPDNASLPSQADQEVRVICSPKGHLVVLDDNGNQVVLQHKDGQKITLTQNSITLEVKNGCKLEIGASSVKINDTAFEVDK